MAQYKTPGVYIAEIDAFPKTVVAVPTAVPAFIGYTERAGSADQPLAQVPYRIESMADYEACFGGPPPMAFTYADTTGQGGAHAYSVTPPATPFLLYYSLQLYFMNGGGPCYVVSVGPYAATPGVADYTAALTALERLVGPTLLVAPDVAKLAPDVAEAIPPLVLAHCGKIQDRFAIFDVPRGDQPRGAGTDDQIAGFRASVGTDFLGYGAAYYPWLNTSVVAKADFRAIAPASIGAFQASLQREADQRFPNGGDNGALKPLTDAIANPNHDLPDAQADTLHQALMASSPLYQQVMHDILAHLNRLPPSAAMAGVYCTVDARAGVSKAPANVSVNAAVSPAVLLSDADQEDLNLPPDGKAVNAIRLFPVQGTLVWGARTLDGNSQDWRYINVRRTAIMLEQSIKVATRAYVFEPNTAATWVAVHSAIGNFLTSQWKEGVLQGATPDDAFSVAVGLGSTMTGEDILDGYLRVTVQVALIRPAEFIEITFQQKMQES